MSEIWAAPRASEASRIWWRSASGGDAHQANRRSLAGLLGEAAAQVGEGTRLELLDGLFGALHRAGGLGDAHALEESQLDGLALLGGQAGQRGLQRLSIQDAAVLGAGL